MQQKCNYHLGLFVCFENLEPCSTEQLLRPQNQLLLEIFIKGLGLDFKHISYLLSQEQEIKSKQLYQVLLAVPTNVSEFLCENKGSPTR